MNQVPTMISTKDLSYLEDMMNWNFTAAKTVNHFSEEVCDDEIKQQLDEVFTMYKKHYQELLEMLQIGG